MSQAPHSQDTGHEGPIKTPKQLAVAVVAAFVVPIIIIILLAGYVTAGNQGSSGSDALTAEATAKRIAPVAQVEVKSASANAGPQSGQAVFNAQCSSCHATGMMGAPKFGDASAWAPRLASGLEALVHSALKGKNAMPAQGGGDFTDFEVARAVVYMANNGGAKFTEPAAPATVTAAASAAASAP